MADLVTWAQVRAALTLEDDREEIIKFLISAASAQAEKYAGRFLAASDVSIKLDSRGGAELLLPSYPVTGTGRLCVDANRVFPAEKDVPAGDYGVKADSGIIRLYRGRFPAGYEVVLFEGNIGYDPVPADLQQAVIETVAANNRRFTGSGGGGIGVKHVSTNGAITTQFEIDVPVSARSVFMSYREARV
jgi:hypothetical protein